jgi:hypothetical protein
MVFYEKLLSNEGNDTSAGVSKETQKKRKAAMLPVCACWFLEHKLIYCGAAR